MVGKVMGFLKREDTAVDPVCHMTVSTKNPPGGTHVHKETTYFFCGPGCRVKFSREPDAYLSGQKGGHM